MSREEQIAPSHLAVLRVAVNVVPACVLNESGVLYVESPPYQAFREVFKLAVVDVSDGPDGEQARGQLIPLDQGAPGVQSGEEELHQQCFLRMSPCSTRPPSIWTVPYQLLCSAFLPQCLGCGLSVPGCSWICGQQKSHWSIFLSLTTRLCLFPMDMR